MTTTDKKTAKAIADIQTMVDLFTAGPFKTEEAKRIAEQTRDVWRECQAVHAFIVLPDRGTTKQ